MPKALLSVKVVVHKLDELIDLNCKGLFRSYCFLRNEKKIISEQQEIKILSNYGKLICVAVRLFVNGNWKGVGSQNPAPVIVMNFAFYIREK